MLSATANCRWQPLPVICQHCHLTRLYYCIYSACGSYCSLEFGKYVAWGHYWIFPFLLSPKTPSACCNSAMSMWANSWLCSHVIFPAIALRRSSLLPTSWLQRLWEKCENIWDKKNYIKENNPKSSASNSKNWVWNIYILTEAAWKCRSHDLNHKKSCARKNIYYFIAISRSKGKFLSRLNINASRGWPLNGVLTNPFLFFLLDFFFFLFLSLIPSKMGGKPLKVS